MLQTSESLLIFCKNRIQHNKLPILYQYLGSLLCKIVHSCRLSKLSSRGYGNNFHFFCLQFPCQMMFVSFTSNTMDVTSRTGSADPSGSPEFNLRFLECGVDHCLFFSILPLRFLYFFLFADTDDQFSFFKSFYLRNASCAKIDNYICIAHSLWYNTLHVYTYLQ